MISAGFGMFTGAINKVLGVQLLRDVQTFVAAFDTMFGGFGSGPRRRSGSCRPRHRVPRRRRPRAGRAREASYFVERLAEERMPLAGLVVNRVHESAADALSAARSQAAAETLEERGEHTLTAALLRLHTDRMQLAAREERLRDHFASTHPTVPATAVPAQAEDVHDLDGLRQVGEDLAAPTSTPTAA